MGGTVEALAAWAAALGPAQIPARVRPLLLAQRASVLAAVAASAGDEATGRVVAAAGAGAPEGPAPLWMLERTARVEEALYCASAASIALDFDDYGLFGHSGHSAVLVPMLLATETGSDEGAQLAAQAAANEIALRLGGACLLGPLNGQLWSFIHAAAAAVAAGKLLGLDARGLAQALSIALYQAPRPTIPGFMAPDSKLLTAADPSLVGLRAARLAAGGVTGPLDVLDHRQGFLEAFSYAPLRSLLDGLGRGWAIETLCIKPYPGCAYVDTTVDAVLALGPLEAAAIEAVDVEAGLLTCGMDGMSRRYARAPGGPSPTPVTVTFSVPWNVALAARAGRLGPDEVSTSHLAAHAEPLSALASRVRVHHRFEHTRRTLEAVAPVLSPRAVAEQLGLGRVLAALGRMGREHRAVQLGVADAVALVRWASTAGAGRAAGFEPWDREALAGFRMAFPARVRVRLSDGRVLEEEREVPRGGAGHPTEGPVAVAREKLATHAPRLWGEERARRLVAAFDGGSLPLP